MRSLIEEDLCYIINKWLRRKKDSIHHRIEQDMYPHSLKNTTYFRSRTVSDSRLQISNRSPYRVPYCPRTVLNPLLLLL